MEDFTEKLKRHNDELYDNGDQIICGFHKAILRLFDVDTSRLTEDELSVLRAPADEGSSNSWVEQCCENAKRTCPKHNEWQTLRMEELETELEYAAKCVQRLLREESEIVAMLEKRMEVSVSRSTGRSSWQQNFDLIFFSRISGHVWNDGRCQLQDLGGQAGTVGPSQRP